MKKDFCFRLLFWACWLIVVSICSYFIVANAQWCIGDDAIIISHTGSGKPFTPGDMVLPSVGRFFPFAYLLYDCLLPFTQGYLSAAAHFGIHLIMFVVLSSTMALLFAKMFKELEPICLYSFVFLGTLAIVFRLYPDYLNCFSTIWGSYTLLSVFVLFAWLFWKHKRKIYAYIALLAINYAIYCLECEFVIPFALGVGGLVFMSHKDPKSAWFYWALTGSALLFMIIYGIVVLPHIETVYDAGHGAELSLVSNALNQLLGNKVILLAIVVAVIRIWDILKNKSEYTFYDNLILATAGYCCACFILRLNWTMYYNLGALVCFPAVLYFSWHYFKTPVTLLVLIAFIGLYGHKLPGAIKDNQYNRIRTVQQVSSLVGKYHNGQTLIWYAPEVEYDWNVEMRRWKESCLREYIRWMEHNPSFTFDEANDFSSEQPGIWLEANENELICPDEVEMRIKPICFDAGGIKGYLIK